MDRKERESIKKRKPVHQAKPNRKTLGVSGKQLKTSETKKITFSDAKLREKGNKQKLQ